MVGSLFNKCLLDSYHGPGIILRVGDTTVNKKAPCGALILVGETDSEQIGTYILSGHDKLYGSKNV